MYVCKYVDILYINLQAESQRKPESSINENIFGSLILGSSLVFAAKGGEKSVGAKREWETEKRVRE